MYSILEMLVAAIFYGTLFSVPALVAVRLFKIQLWKINKELLVRSVNCTLLLGSLCFIITILVELYSAFYSGGEYEQYSFSGGAAGSFWLEFLIWGVIGYSILPQILWIVKIQKSIIYSCILVIFWYIPLIITKRVVINSWHVKWYNFTDYLIWGCAYCAVVSINYFLFNKRKLHSEPV